MVREDGKLSDAEIAELAAFADGSLPARRRRKVAAAVERSPELRALLDEQRAALAAVRAVDVPAPARLRARVESSLPRPKPRPRWRGLALPAGIAAATAASVLLAVLVIPGGGSDPTVAEAAALADRGPSAPAPRPERKEPNLLAASVDGIAFPDYLEMLGWRASGERADDLDDRATRTVYYERARDRIAYTIVSGDQLEWPPDWKQTRRDGVQLRSTERDGTTTVTWLREARTCVLSGADVPREELLALAAWKGEGTVSF
jgi:anti-sigma factor RsiW